MLTELHISNFAIIEQLNVLFAPGLVVFTGETGAGKSIIIDAVETLLGGRAEATQVRSGTERAIIEAVFQIPDTNRRAVWSILEREELVEEDDDLIISREIRLNGRNIARINGHSVSASIVREISEFLIDIHGQSEHLSLLKVNQHLNLLDRFATSDGKTELQNSFNAYTRIYRRIQEVNQELDEIRQAEVDAARQVELLTFQLKEIEAAHLQPGEEDVLREERTRLANAENLAAFSLQAIIALDEGSPESPAAIDLVGQAFKALSDLTHVDPSQAGLTDFAGLISDQINELTRSVRSYLENIEFNPKRLDQVEERLALIQSLKHKYGETIQAVLHFSEKVRRQLDQITHSEERIEQLEKERAHLLEKIGEEGIYLSKQRHAAAQKLEEGIEKELADLHMSGAHFRVDFRQTPDDDGARLPDGRRLAYYAHGLEKIEFLIAPNPGEGFKPLVKIASGGETSRLMLALKNVLVQADQVPVLIFDEIDQGIGGRVGGIVGEKLRQLGRRHQVLCITHLPQLAAYGEQHFRVEKKLHQGRTTTTVELLEGDARLHELAQMMGGISKGTIQSAQELLQSINL